MNKVALVLLLGFLAVGLVWSKSVLVVAGGVILGVVAAVLIAAVIVWGIK